MVSKLGVDRSSAMSAASVATTLRQTRKIVPPTLCPKFGCNDRSSTQKEMFPAHPSNGTSLKTLTMRNRAMAISQRTRPTSKTSSAITVTTSTAPHITDAKANITQFNAYLPLGELLVDEHSSEEMPYKLNGKVLCSYRF